MDTNKRVIEINGVKLEIDLRDAKVIDQYKVGDTIKILIKGYSDYKSHLGVIVGFDNFEKHPTIVIAYLEVEYSTANIRFAYYNSESKDVEIAKINDWDIPYSKSSIIEKLDTEYAKKEEELRELKSKKEVFINMFGKYFEEKPAY
jgi:hypothetical protein